MSSDTAGPLDGLRVVDCSGMISGGFATTQLADFGADVIMVEHPEYKDSLRAWPPFDHDTSLWWKSIGRNKRCVTLNLSAEEGAELLLELISDADVFIENFRPGTIERWGLGPDVLQELNPELVIVRISGYGQTGPRSDKPGFGTVAEGLSGWAHANGFPDREPLLPPISLADLTTAMFAVQATMFAIYEREAGGQAGTGSGTGQVVDVSLYEPLYRLFLGEVEGYDKTGTVRKRTGNRHPNAAPRNVYETKDGYMTLSASNQRTFERVMHAIDREDLIDDPRFADNDGRVENVEPLDNAIEAWTTERTTADAVAEMEAHDAIVGPVYTIADIFEDEQFQARNNVIEVDDADVGRIKTAGPVPKFSRTPGRVNHMGPGHGEHNDEIFGTELGRSAEELDELREAGVL